MADSPRHGSARRAERRDRAIPPREARRGDPHQIMKPVPPRLDSERERATFDVESRQTEGLREDVSRDGF